MSLLSKNIAANLLSNIWLALLLLLLTPLYIWLLGVESYGLIGFYLSWIAILSNLDSAISATAVREIAWLSARPGEKGKIPTLLRSLECMYWCIILILGLGILAGAWFFGAEWFKTKDLPPEMVREALMLMAVSLMVQVPSGLYIAGLMGLQRQVECSVFLVFFGTVRGLGALGVLGWISPDIRLFFLWQIFASAFQTSVIRGLLWKRVRMEGNPARFSVEILQSIQGFAGAMILIAFLSIALMQADKMILSRMVPLEIFGFYMLAWTVASGLSRVTTPLTQAFNPHFTELISSGDEESLARKQLLVSQLMNVMILPPVALIIFLSQPILFAWTGNPDVAEGAASILSVMMVGTALSACSYPSLSILFGRKRLKPVIVINVISLVVLLPLLIFGVLKFGAIGAAYIWGFYGLILFVTYQAYAMRGISKSGLFLFIFRNFGIPCGVSFIVAGVAAHWLRDVDGKIAFVILLGFALIAGWSSALLVSKELLKTVMEKLKWKTKISL